MCTNVRDWKFSEAKQYFEGMHAGYCVKITECIQTHLEWSDMNLFRDIIVMLATQGWQKNTGLSGTNSV